jgi:uncharacterized protein YdhG (YjbR/CyaY superfamily)
MSTGRSLLTVDKYLTRVPTKDRAALEKVREAILSAAPHAEELISYGIPTYKYMGPLIHFMAGKKHLSLIGVHKDIAKTFAKELKKFKVSGTTIHFTAEAPIPTAVITKIVKLRIKQNSEIAKKKILKSKKTEMSQVKKCPRGHKWSGKGACRECHGRLLDILGV